MLMGKVVWITGASSGIGEELAYALAACGARLVLSARGERGLRRVLERCKGTVQEIIKIIVSIHFSCCYIVNIMMHGYHGRMEIQDIPICINNLVKH